MLGSVLNKDKGQFQIRVRANSILGQGQLGAQLGFKIEFGLVIRRLHINFLSINNILYLGTKL